MSDEDRTTYGIMKKFGEDFDVHMTFGQIRSIEMAGKRSGLEQEEAMEIFLMAREKDMITDPFTPDVSAVVREGEREQRNLLLQSQRDRSPSGAGFVEGQPYRDETGGYDRRTSPTSQPVDPTTIIAPSGGGSLASSPHGVKSYFTGDIFNQFKEYKDGFGSSMLAQVALFGNEDLAARLQLAPETLTRQELSDAVEAMGGLEKWKHRDGVTFAQAAWIERRLAHVPQKVQVDITGTMETARQLASTWNLPDMGTAGLRSIGRGLAEIQIGAARTELGNPWMNNTLSFDDSITATDVPNAYAYAASKLRSLPIYAELFAHRRSGESEVAYASRFGAKVQGAIGDTSPSLARSGMRTGDPRTVARRALFSKEGAESSTMQGNLAKLGQVFREFT
jgi:hypothetical protein